MLLGDLEGDVCYLTISSFLITRMFPFLSLVTSSYFEISADDEIVDSF